MTNIPLALEDYEDLETVNMIAERREKGFSDGEILASARARSRDNARTPMQWDDSENAGFTTGTPWFFGNPNYREINAAAALRDPESVFWFYRRLIALRKELAVLREGDFALLCPEDPAVFAYVRRTPSEKLLVVCNMTGNEQAFAGPPEFASGRLLLSNYGDDRKTPGLLRPWETRMEYLEG